MATFKRSAIDVLTISTIAKRAKSHFDALVSGLKTAKAGRSTGYGYNVDVKTYVNPAFDVESLKVCSDEIEEDIRSIKSAIVKHNASTKVSFYDEMKEDERSVSIFEAFNILKDYEGDLSRAHGEQVNNLSTIRHKDEVVAADELPFEDPKPGEDDYWRLLATILRIKASIAKANNKPIEIEIKSDFLIGLI